MNDEPADRKRWDESMVNALPDSILLIGLTYLTAEGEFVGQQQFFGKVRSAQPDQGILVDLRGARVGEAYNLPPDTRFIHRAAPGEYRLRSTGKVVHTCDFPARDSALSRVLTCFAGGPRRVLLTNPRSAA